MAKFNSTACCLLGYLHGGPRSGWDLSEEVHRTIGYFWNVTRSQIYRELRTLEKHGLVEGGERGQRDRRSYTITEEGRRVFAEWLSREPEQELFRFPLLLTVWFGEHLEAEELEWFLRLHRARHEKLTEHYAKLEEALPEEELASPRGWVLRFGMLYERAVMEWFDSLPPFRADKKRLRRAERTP